jgi:hypothetical protein
MSEAFTDPALLLLPMAVPVAAPIAAFADPAMLLFPYALSTTPAATASLYIPTFRPRRGR